MLARMSTPTHAHRVPDRPPTLSRVAAAVRLGVHPKTIDRWVRRGLLVRHRDRHGHSGVEIAGIEAIERDRISHA